MSVALKKIEGVESVKVSLQEGRASIVLKPTNAVRLQQIYKAVNEQGFTPKEARVKAVGELAAINGELQFKVAAIDDIYKVADTWHVKWQKIVGTKLLVAGLVPEPKSDKLHTIQVTDIERQETAK